MLARIRAPRGASRVRWCLRVVASMVMWLGVIAALAIGGLFAALARGPISLDWLTPTLAASLNDLYSGKYAFGLREAVIANGDHGPTLSVEGLTVKSGEHMILAAPRAELSVDLRSLLLGRIKPRRLEAIDLELRLSVLADGSLSVSAGADSVNPVSLSPKPSPVAASPADPGIAAPSSDPAAAAAPPASAPVAPAAAAPLPRVALLRQAADALRDFVDLATSPDSALSAVDRLGVLHGRLVIDDKTVGRVISYNDFTLSLDKAPGSMHFGLAASDGARRLSVVAIAKGAPGEARVVDARLRDLSIDELALVGGWRNPKFDTDAPLSLDVRFVVGQDNHISEATAHVGVGVGFFRLEDPDHEPVMIDKISATARWDRAARRIVIDPVDIKAGGFDMTVIGEARPPAADASGEDEAWPITLQLAKPTSVAPERAGQKPVAVERGGLAARINFANKKATLERFELTGPDIAASLVGGFDWANGPHVVYELTLTDSHGPAILRLWPTHVASGVRMWLMEHVSKAVVRRATFGADFDEPALIAMRYELPPPDAATHGEAEIVNGTLSDLLPGLAPFTGIAGNLRLTGRTASFVASAGVLEQGAGRRLTMSDGGFTVADDALRPTPAVVELKLAGNIDAVADVLALPSIAPFASLPIEASLVKGQIDGKLRLDFEIGATARADHTIVTIDAKTSGLSIDHFVGAERLENAALDVVSDHAGLHVSGNGRLYGAPATLDIRRPRGDKGAAQAQLTFMFDEAARAKAGFGFAGVSGPVAAILKTPVPVGEVDTQVELDLTRATLDNPLPGVSKAAGRPGKASFVLARRADTISLDHLAFDAGGAQIAGSVELTREGAFRSAKFSQLRLSPGDDLHVDAQRGGDALKLTVRGANLDARPLLRGLMQGGEQASGAGAGAGASKSAMSFDDFDLDLKSSLVTGYGKQILSNVDLKMERRNGHPRALLLGAMFGREQLGVQMKRQTSQAPEVEISTNDAGSFFSFLDIYKRMESGVLNATFQLSPGRADGTMQVRDFYLKNEPAVRQLMTQGVVRPDASGAMHFDHDTVRFSRLQAGFTWAGGRLALREGVMSGPEIGLTFDGALDFARDRVDVSGAYVPAYALNNLLGNIPLFGEFLGGRHEGLFALNYRITGDINAPSVVVNPLSAIAPGLLRKIMGVMDGTQRPPDAGGR